ncbi:MAG: hypothetical protein UX82_C0007G0023 [Microgenomates group bacterium GW2011_GWE1_47_12]|nr:MAG: hypothetical protein UX32_C0006G0030 [Microgenomates group bacterium GW2011_GWF1_46_12]KKU43519.1 MAG: hypothetical protein UX59_C0015G0010 [Microgenomates group bacterium GW2011_GWA1_46_7]KKU45055.1 MAG: hypothetical protein UX63_C0013G0005 [Microgenomates group bacterium GW2011_GWB1_46_7]KKU60826.1 MAG: hypothetical protein UX82_C0007G0023 [Microgenomates group bacterium GW2011_GWE1_47_12]
MEEIIKCQNCTQGFVWSKEEQKLYKSRGLPSPRYCPICRGIIEARERDHARNKYER